MKSIITYLKTVKQLHGNDLVLFKAQRSPNFDSNTTCFHTSAPHRNQGSWVHFEPPLPRNMLRLLCRGGEKLKAWI